jgi:Xaa-Pro aminopeptidase
MNDHFSADFFAGNRARLRELFTGTAPIVITANGQLQRGGDSTFPFHQDANFWYLTGVDEPDLILVMDKDKEYLILSEEQDYRDIFDGRQDPGSLSQTSGIGVVMNAKSGWKQLESRLRKVKHVATLAASPAYVSHFGFYVNPARAALTQKIKDIKPTIELLDLRMHLARLRMIKQPAELAVMQRAIDIGNRALGKVKTKLPRLSYEYEVEAEITSHVLRSGAQDAWKPIVASGVNACTLHSSDNNTKLGVGTLIVIDIGVEVSHYCSDISRTFSTDGHPGRRAQAVYSAVKEIQNFAIGLQKPGASIKENEKKVEVFLGECLRELNLIKTIDRDTVRQFFPHATSHFLGLDPHDAGDYDRPLEPGMVLTVEPGIYIPKEGLGVRLEDDILITPGGYKNLSAKLPRKL